MQVEQAMNEVIEFFSSFLILLPSFKNVPIAFKRASNPRHCSGEIKNKFLSDMFSLPGNITGLKPIFNKSLIAISC